MRARIRLALSFAFLAWSADAMAAEITALSGINLPFFSSKPSSFIRTGNGLFAAALVKFEAGSGNFETGILRNGMSATHS
ncbi:MAG: hypothetical protein EBX52_14445, partial [Proteobacteria bacterium]|nr:hypothetical protein [Pseudomonadota bacterium]